MDTLVILQGPQPGRQFLLKSDRLILGRQADCGICLESQAVSRQHAQILRENDGYFIEDLDSSNGTYLNGRRLVPRTRMPLTETDRLELGPYLFALRPASSSGQSDSEVVIREQVSVALTNQNLFGKNPAHQLQVVLEIAHNLGRTLDMDALLGKLLDQLLRLFPQADRGIVLLKDGDHLSVRAQRCRRSEDPSSGSYSRTIIKRALDDGIGILSEDIRHDERFAPTATISSLNVRSLLCVPLIGSDKQRLGAIQLDHARQTAPFSVEDLQMLTALSLQVALVLENAALHAEVLREERLRQELEMAHDIQQSFLPTEFPEPEKVGFEMFARVTPARQVSGDLYDFLTLKDGRLAFFVGDVSGKGMPASLFMVAVRTLSRHLAAEGASPAMALARLNTALAADNTTGLFVTLVHGIYQPATGEVVLASGGHPPPLLRRADGRVEEVAIKSGMLLGYTPVDPGLSDGRLTLAPGETLILYTDGYIEGRAPDRKTMFGVDRLREALGGPRTQLSLKACADYATAAVERFTASKELQDDLTLFLLRRR
jgi:serine phosphatase RsbU (regulator of sigma subunit)/pSer/pThr/pTyr-binding forkhead associated (FHA) protein